MSNDLTPDQPAPRKKSAARLAREERWRTMISHTVSMLSRRAYKHEILALLRHRYSTSTRTAQRVLARARDELCKRAGKTREQHRTDAYAFYESVIRDPEAGLGERMYAQARIDALLGLQAPQEHRLGQSDEAGPVQIVETVVRTREEASALLGMKPQE